MQNSQLKDTTIRNAEEFCLVLFDQTFKLLKAIEAAAQLPKNVSIKPMLDEAIKPLRSLPYQLSDVVIKWKSGRPQVLSKLGIEVEVLNELMVNLTACFLFFLSRDMDIGEYIQNQALTAYKELLLCNKLLTEI